MCKRFHVYGDDFVGGPVRVLQEKEIRLYDEYRIDVKVAVRGVG